MSERPALEMDQLGPLAGEDEGTPLLLQKRVLVTIVALFLLVVVAYVVASRYFGLANSIEAEPFQDWVEELGPWGPVAFIGIMALSVLFAPIPNVPIFIAAGLAWGTALGTVYSMAGMMLGSSMAFYISRYFGRRYVDRLIGRKAAKRLDSMVEAMGGRMVFWARILPVVNFDWISFLAGLTSIRFWPFFLYSMLGMLIPTVLAVEAGSSLGKDIRITLGVGGLWVAGILASAAFFYWRHRRRGRASTVSASMP